MFSCQLIGAKENLFIRVSIALFFVLTDFLYETKAKQVYKPKLVNSKSGDHHDFPLGVLEATGRLRDGEREILIMDVGRGGVGERSGLQVGDRIKKIENITPDKFSKKTDAGLSGPQDLLGRSLDKKPGHSNRSWC